MKRKLSKNNNAVAPIVWFAVAGILTVVGLGVYQITQRPDITYNISETGFSIAGVDVSWFLIIAVVVVMILIFFWIGRKRQPQNKT